MGEASRAQGLAQEALALSQRAYPAPWAAGGPPWFTSGPAVILGGGDDPNSCPVLLEAPCREDGADHAPNEAGRVDDEATVSFVVRARELVPALAHQVLRDLRVIIGQGRLVRSRDVHLKAAAALLEDARAHLPEDLRARADAAAAAIEQLYAPPGEAVH